VGPLDLVEQHGAPGPAAVRPRLAAAVLAELVSLRERSRLLYRVLVAGALLSVPLAAYVMVTPDVMERLRLLLAYFVSWPWPARRGGLDALRGDRYAPWVLVARRPWPSAPCSRWRARPA
jgi:hypothetical protein